MVTLKKILIADDDTHMVDALKTLLENVGYATVTTNDPKEVITLAKKERPDLIILDVVFEGMPGPNGFELSKEISKEKELQMIPVIIVSGVKNDLTSAFVGTPDERGYPVAVFLDKPVRPAQLLSAIKNIL